MTSHVPEPIDPRQLRVSDNEREQVAERLREAAGEGRLGLDELEDRITAVYTAKTYAELEPITRDLPAATGAGPGGRPRSARARGRWRVGRTPDRRKTFVVMGGSEQQGRLGGAEELHRLLLDGRHRAGPARGRVRGHGGDDQRLLLMGGMGSSCPRA